MDDVARRDRVRRPSLDAVWATIAVLLPVAATWFMPTQALDLAYHLRAGHLMLDTGSILRTDVFTYTIDGAPWLNQQWGAQIVLGAVRDVAGWGGLNLLRGAMVGLTTFFVYRASRSLGAPARTAAVLTLAGWFVGIQIAAMLRPQLFGTLLFAATLWILADRRRRPNRVWWLPLVAVVWANAHGSFPLVFVAIGLALLDDVTTDHHGMRRLLWVGLACVAATFVSPFGWGTWGYVLDLMRDPFIREQVAEWAPTSIDTFAGIAFFTSLLGVLVILARRWAPAPWVGIGGIVLFAAIAIGAYRGIAWWAIAAPVLVTAVLVPRSEVPDAAPVTTPDRSDRSWANVAVIGALVLLCAMAAFSGRGVDPRSGGPAMLTAAPQTLVDAVQNETEDGANVFVSQLFSSWVEYAAPGSRVPVDARIELIPGSVWDDYFTVSEAQDGWQEILDRDDVTALILARDQAAGLLEQLEGDTGWRLLVEDDEGAAYVRA